jgi:polysaccharide biosynthesis PFTS motif protein
MVRIAKEDPSSNEPLHKITRMCSPKKIIGVFDTSFTETCPLGYRDMIQFVEGLLCLLDEIPDLGIIYKNKNSLQVLSEHVPEILPYYKKLQDRPRCYFTDLEKTDPTECIVASALVISAPFTSSTIEALGAGTRALY